MSNLRRHIMMQQAGGAASYVQDGLVFWLDGMDMGSSGWVEKINGLVFENHGATKLDNGYEFDGVSSYMSVSGKFSFDRPVVETCIKGTIGSSDAMIIIYGGNWNKLGIYLRQGFIMDLAHSNVNAPYYVNLSGLSSISYSFANESYLNGALMTKAYVSGGSVGTNDRDETIIGRRFFSGSGNQLYFRGILHSVRVYNRVLTYDERMQNYAADLANFG